MTDMETLLCEWIEGNSHDLVELKEIQYGVGELYLHIQKLEGALAAASLMLEAHYSFDEIYKNVYIHLE